ncbi:hypothetical protein RJT34_13808 [Clitoria ternatea]|uniref:Uncharacterized protein n=1 Tax=Clitoria ternatea TaxID=43366 RepID=A0AAN9JRR3_CLITE
MGSVADDGRIAMAVLVMIGSLTGMAYPCTTIFSFGDSLADTGNLNVISPSNYCFSPPYGQTFFHHPSGRCSDGRLIIDFIAESLGIPAVKPYLGMKKFGDLNSAVKGANFAVAGSTALDFSFLQERGIHAENNYSLTVQLNWFREFLHALCSSSHNCHEVVANSLFLVGEIGGNDFNYALFQQKSIPEIKTFVPYVLNAIVSAVNELIDLGARTLMIPGDLPLGCSARYLTIYGSMDKNEYDQNGCLKWLNEFVEYYNQKLQSEINRLRRLHPYANLIYADYYNAALPLYNDPTILGFPGLKICCGNGGPYNYNTSAVCGDPGVIACDNPSQYIGWDGLHLTEAAYKFITDGLINGPYSHPQFKTLCFMNVSCGYFNTYID